MTPAEVIREKALQFALHLHRGDAHTEASTLVATAAEIEKYLKASA